MPVPGQSVDAVCQEPRSEADHQRADRIQVRR